METSITQSAQHLPRRKVIIAGATGLVGGFILQALLDDPSVTHVQALGRRELALSHPKLKTRIVDFKKLPELDGADEVYLALGTTMKVARSQANFRAVDLDANWAVAQAAYQAGVRRVGLVSAVGAHSQSSVFYNQVKGELEDQLQTLDWQALVIAQPSLLLDYRHGLEQPTRWGEILAIPLAQLLKPIIPGVYRPVHAKSVAKSLVRVVPRASGVVVLASNELANSEL